MAITVYKYKFRGKSDHYHLAIALTNVSSSSSDPYANYISYYAYQGSQTQQNEYNAATKTMMYSGVGGSGACYMYQTPYSKKGFGAATKSYDGMTLELMETVVIPTKQDGVPDSQYDEEVIARQWSDARSWALADGKDYDPSSDYKKNVTFKIPFHFDIKSRHCGSIVQNVLENNPIHSVSLQQMKISDALNQTFMLAQQKSNEVNQSVKDKDNFISYSTLNDFYSDYKKSKSFFQSDSVEMHCVAQFLDKYKGFEHVPTNHGIAIDKRSQKSAAFAIATGMAAIGGGVFMMMTGVLLPAAIASIATGAAMVIAGIKKLFQNRSYNKKLDELSDSDKRDKKSHVSHISLNRLSLFKTPDKHSSRPAYVSQRSDSSFVSDADVSRSPSFVKA